MQIAQMQLYFNSIIISSNWATYKGNRHKCEHWQQKKPQNEIISPAAQINNLSYFIVYSISGFPCRQQSHLVELHHERPDRGIGSVAEVLLKLLGGELFCSVSRQNILPEQPFFFGDFSIGKSGLVHLKISLRRYYIHLQTVINLVAEIGQERRYVRVARDECVLLDTVIGFVVGCLALSNIAGKRREQCRRIALLDKVPKVEQPSRAAIAIKIGMIVGESKMQDSGFMQFVDAIFSVGEINQSFHSIWELLRRKSLPTFFAAIT